MRNLLFGLVLSFGVFAFVLTAAEAPQAPARSPVAGTFGDLPNRGDLQDILSCAGANEVLWTSAMKTDPRNPDAHEAKRKAGWYSAVALWVFEVESPVVIDAVRSASKRDRSAVVALARRCRQAPDSWRE